MGNGSVRALVVWAREFSHGGAVGLRLDVMDRFLVEANDNVLWIDFESSNATSFDGFRLVPDRKH